MSRAWLVPAVVTLGLSSAIAVRYFYKERRAAVHTTAIHAALLKYSNDLKPGATRKAVRDYLTKHRVAFRERCCDEPGGPFSVLVQVGEEDPPCSLGQCEEWHFLTPDWR